MTPRRAHLTALLLAAALGTSVATGEVAEPAAAKAKPGAKPKAKPKGKQKAKPRRRSIKRRKLVNDEVRYTVFAKGTYTRTEKLTVPPGAGGPPGDTVIDEREDMVWSGSGSARVHRYGYPRKGLTYSLRGTEPHVSITVDDYADNRDAQGWVREEDGWRSCRVEETFGKSGAARTSGRIGYRTGELRLTTGAAELPIFHAWSNTCSDGDPPPAPPKRTLPRGYFGWPLPADAEETCQLTGNWKVGWEQSCLWLQETKRSEHASFTFRWTQTLKLIPG